MEYNKKFADLEADGDYNTVTTLFNEGKAQAIIGGPWLVAGIRAAGIDLGVASLSDMTLPNGEPMAPFSGVQGIGVMKVAAETKGDAIALALEAPRFARGGRRPREGRRMRPGELALL